MRASHAALALALWLVACTDAPPGIPRSQLVGPLREATQPDVKRELALRSESDATLRAWLADHGPPDYVAFPSARETTLFYVELDQEVHFARPLWAGDSPEPEPGAIRAHHHRFFSNRDRQRLGDLRREQAHQEERAARRRSREAVERLWRPVPAAPADE